MGRKFDMFGKNENDVSKCEQLLLETNDLRSLITSFAYTHFKNKNLEQLEFIAKNIKKPLVDKLLFGSLKTGGIIKLDIKNDKLVFSDTKKTEKV